VRREGRGSRSPIRKGGLKPAFQVERLRRPPQPEFTAKQINVLDQRAAATLEQVNGIEVGTA
jgi:hypothetical protein